MEQKTEASQAVDDQAVSVEVYSNAVWLTNGMQVFRLAYTGESDVDRNWYAGQLRAALKAQPAPTEAAKGALSANPNLTTSAPTCQPSEAQGNTSNNSSSSQLSGNTGELTQGEDSARLECLNMLINSGAKAWPRSCLQCGLGPCQTGTDRARASAETGGVK